MGYTVKRAISEKKRAFSMIFEEIEINKLCKVLFCKSFLHSVLGERNSGLSQLRDVILTNLAEQLQNNRFGSEDDDHYR